MKKKLLFGLAGIALLTSSCSSFLKPSKEDQSLCFNLLFEAKDLAARTNNSDMIKGLWQDKWCSDYSRMSEDIDVLRDYINLMRTYK